MAITKTDKNEIETIVRKEIKSFLGSNTVKQFEDKLINELQKEFKKGNIKKDIKSVVTDVMVDFYRLMWTRRSFWEPTLRR